ncbi:MAG: 3-keto-disaccharide hydrolase [Thermoguttaceae bacterium]
MRQTALCWIAVLALSCGSALGGEWKSLFDGKTLDGWTVHSGFAKYRVEDGVIVGQAVDGSPNSFLCTNETYGDFILEFDVLVDPNLNSGVQFRSLIAEKDEKFTAEANGKKQERDRPKDRVYGYQVEISTQAQANAGNIYDEARRARFLDDFANRPDAQKAFQDNQWNRYLVVCKGNSIRTWVNGIPCADFEDDATARGTIGLQVHGVPKNKFQPYEVRWRNLRLLKLD